MPRNNQPNVTGDLVGVAPGKRLTGLYGAVLAALQGYAGTRQTGKPGPTVAAPVAGITGTPLSGVAPFTTIFDSTSSTGTISTYAWTFGDGGTSTSANPTHNYAAAGTYSVSLTVTGPGGSNTLTRTAYVSASAFVPPLDAPAWLSAPVGQWSAISGAAAPGGVGANFSGVAWRIEPNRMEVLSALPGGHASGAYVASNPVYSLRLDVDAPAWVTRRAASNSSGWSNTLPTTEYFPSDSRPVPRHTYNCNHWVPELAAYMIGGTFAALNGDLGIIEHRGFRCAEDGGSDDWAARGAYANKAEFHALIDARNTLTGEYLVGNGSSSQFYKWAPSTQTWTAINPTGTPQTAKGGHAFDYRRNAFTFIGSDGRWWTLGTTFLGYTMNATTWAKTAVTINSSAGFTDFSSYLNVWYHASCRYNENDDAYYLYNGNTFNTATAAGRIYKVFPNEGAAWDMMLLSRAGSYASVETVGSDNRFEVLEKYRAAVSIEPGQTPYYYRLPFASQVVVRSGSVAGTLPYTATLLPLRGEVPSGSTIVSPDDATLKASIVSTHDDGSAAVVVVTGETTVTANSTKRLAVTIAAAGADTALTAARIGALVANVTVDFAGAYGSASLTDFSTPERIWWANSRVICARYRLAAPTPGSTALEAVIDISAFGAGHDRALVEVVIENGKLDAAASTFATKPANATYTGATVSVNGTNAATVNSSAAPTGTHQAFRAWYASGWVGGNPALRATQRHMDLQRHPLFWRTDKDNSADLSSYASDAYAPWSTGRHPAANMGGVGDTPSIGPLPEWEARALQSGDYRAWNATEASALAGLSFNVNYRDSVTGLVPDAARMTQKYTKNDGAEGSWPMSADGSTRATWETAHQPAIGLMGFVSRPSPVFIELAQKIAVFSGTLNNDPAFMTLFDAAGAGISDMTGFCRNQIRGVAWGLRACNHATFLSPNGSTWRAGGSVWLGRYARYARSCSLSTYASLNVLFAPAGMTSSTLGDHDNSGNPSMPGNQIATWMHDFLVGELHKAASCRLITDVTEAGYLAAAADFAALARVRFVNEQADGGWRFVPYSATYMKADTSVPATYQEQRLYDRGGWVPATVSGQFYDYPSQATTPSTINASGLQATANDTYTVQFWDALRAAVEREVSGASAAWATVKNNVSNLSTWRAGFTSRPRWGSWPRNL